MSTSLYPDIADLALLTTGQILTYAKHAKGQTALRQALDVLELAIARDPNISFLNKAAHIATKLELSDKALDFLSRAAIVSPGNIVTLGTLAYFHAKLGDDEQAIAIQERLLAQDPRNPYALAELTNLYSRNGRLADAVTAARARYDIATDLSQRSIAKSHEASCLLKMYLAEDDPDLKARLLDDAYAACETGRAGDPSHAILTYQSAKIDYYAGREAIAHRKLGPLVRDQHNLNFKVLYYLVAEADDPVLAAWKWDLDPKQFRLIRQRANEWADDQLDIDRPFEKAAGTQDWYVTEETGTSAHRDR